MESKGCYCINFRRAANSITKYYDDYLKESSLTLNQFSLIKNILKIQPASISDIASKVRLERTTVVRNLKTLFKEGLIEDISKENERNKKVIVTKKGKEVLDIAIPLWQEAQDNIEKILGMDNYNKSLEIFEIIDNL